MFVIAGDLNADPFDSSGYLGAIAQLIEHPAIQGRLTWTSPGAEAMAEQGGANRNHLGPRSQDTGDFPDNGPGNLRVDYCLPSRKLRVVGSGVYWPLPNQEGSELVTASDHRLVWTDVAR